MQEKMIQYQRSKRRRTSQWLSCFSSFFDFSIFNTLLSTRTIFVQDILFMILPKILKCATELLFPFPCLSSRQHALLYLNLLLLPIPHYFKVTRWNRQLVWIVVPQIHIRWIPPKLSMEIIKRWLYKKHPVQFLQEEFPDTKVLSV